ncbi:MULTISPECIES: prephenate dehydrogenase [Brevibacillus]|jgi:prephenate dehydrogenase|uniref:Prephenate dehydrogenase n=1 Tax=Brevibacillus aydinogluensis TaxID=927786 RepID=A0AA48RCF9_9BACL|nr:MULTISPECIES: prephenate dehydrogenase [Brevibacillus]MBR8658542.1 prephenate dehydrogenase [Brevibacillus sp. NL20B1]NNV02135.1 prephenate dehydrogenase [Brevibacillus sp. MCWH]REK62218.1 MAG: prephenate dehydrogenase [Brevibacillus sp.]CAJ1002833.1 prephenate dehydrogenase [Brevibacillus aydinogluensis]
MNTTTITVIGVGLIGGSIALALRGDEHNRIIGFDVRQDFLDKALALGVIHAGTTDLQEAVREADVIFLAVPVEQIYATLDRLRNLDLKPGVIVTDVGSTKSGVVRFAEAHIPSDVTFIGGHPMAGSHKSGVEAASDRLFENAYYVLTPAPGTPEEQVERLEKLLALTRAKVVRMDPDEHDQVVGAVSHFPHILASALVNLVAGYDNENPWHHRLAAGGFRDITRIASSNPRMWRDVLLNNREHLLKIADDWARALDGVMALVREGDADRIEQFFKSAREFRDGLPERKKGALPPLYDLYIDIPDHPGEIGRITTLLGAKQINITNIQIRETREDMLGVLRITFRSLAELEKGEELLRFFDYNVYRRE